ncbi:MAG: phosphocholine cytidylyltransferase family protein [Planctomycetes bacterium]|nr:phosphocholine cytidylyltransferase family protein [Planctomycetota bacterium]
MSLGAPKCLIDIGGTSIIRRQVAAFRAAGVERLILVVGYQQDQVRRHLADDPGPFTFVVNERYAETNTIYSLYLTREHCGEGFFYANGDVVFDRQLTQRLAGPDSDGATRLAVKPGRCGQEEVKVIVADGRIARIGKQLDPACALGEFVGVARFGREIIPAFRDTLTRCVEAEGIVGDHFEQAVDRLCVAGHLATPVDVGDLPCGEIDFAEDLRHARETIAPRLIA